MATKPRLQSIVKKFLGHIGSRLGSVRDVDGIFYKLRLLDAVPDSYEQARKYLVQGFNAFVAIHMYYLELYARAARHHKRSLQRTKRQLFGLLCGMYQQRMRLYKFTLRL